LLRGCGARIVTVTLHLAIGVGPVARSALGEARHDDSSCVLVLGGSPDRPRGHK
jgi:hypothetical protein